MSGGRGAGNPPLTYEGDYDTAQTYLPRQVVKVAGKAFMSLAKQTGVDPPAASWQPFFQSNTETVNVVAASGAAVTLPDPDVASINRVTLTANCTFTFPTLTPGKSFTLTLEQDATGSRTAVWPADVKWPGDIPPTLTATPGSADVVSFMADDALVWRGFIAGQNYSPLAASTVGSYGLPFVATDARAAAYSVSQDFTTTSGPSFTVSAIEIEASSDGGHTGNSLKVGIATAIGTTDAGVTWLGTPATANFDATPGGPRLFTLPSPVTLAPSTTYYVVVLGNTPGAEFGAISVGENNTLGPGNAAGRVSATLSNAKYAGSFAQNLGGTWTDPFTGFQLRFNLLG